MGELSEKVGVARRLIDSPGDQPGAARELGGEQSLGEGASLCLGERRELDDLSPQLFPIWHRTKQRAVDLTSPVGEQH